MKNSAILLISCPDRKGEVATIADFVFRHGGDIPLADFGKYFSPIAETFAMKWRLAQSSHRPRMIIFVSKYDHCLVDLLYRQQSGELACEIPLIVSNHPDNQPVADFYKIPYAVVPVIKENKQAAEKQIHSLLDECRPDFIVLARYMQILSQEFVNRYQQRIINIHHSFLPAFVGARPYHQAFERGVKLIGATSHYVTQVLDDGPIIEQDVVRVSHRDTVEDLIRKGRDLEKVVLSRAVRSHVENRVLVYGNKTVVF